jgi:hypothetical protein
MKRDVKPKDLDMTLHYGKSPHLFLERHSGRPFPSTLGNAFLNIAGFVIDFNSLMFP